MQDVALKLGLANAPKHWSFYMNAFTLTLVLWLQAQLLFGTAKDYLWLYDSSQRQEGGVGEEQSVALS